MRIALISAAFAVLQFCLLPPGCVTAGNDSDVASAGDGWNPALPWPGKSGPFANGNVPPKSAGEIPVQWSEASGENIAWKIPLEAQGHSTPVVAEGRIWFTAANEDGTKQFIYCVRQADGEVLHHKLLFENEDPEPLGNPINNYAAPSCAAEPGAVYVHFGAYGTARLEPESAEVVWQRRDIKVRHFRGPGSSPVIHENLLILTFDGIDKQFVTALDKSTGETVWRTARTTDYGDLDENGQPQREGDLRKAYSTPAIADVEGRVQVISVGSRAAFGYDAYTGEEIWTVRHDDFNAAAQPLVYRDLVIMNTGGRGANILAVKLDETTRGDVTETHVVWDRPRGNSRLSFPVLADGRIYFVTDAGVANCVDAETGKEVWTGRLGGNYIASPLVAKDRVYFFSIEGTTTVARAGNAFEVISKNELQEGMRASPAAADGALFLRTHGHLYKIASEGTQG